MKVHKDTLFLDLEGTAIEDIDSLIPMPDNLNRIMYLCVMQGISNLVFFSRACSKDSELTDRQRNAIKDIATKLGFNEYTCVWSDEIDSAIHELTSVKFEPHETASISKEMFLLHNLPTLNGTHYFVDDRVIKHELLLSLPRKHNNVFHNTVKCLNVDRLYNPNL